MSDVSVKFGASDEGLEQTLKKVQAELGQMRIKVKSVDLSLDDLDKTMRRVGQLESLEKRLNAIGDEASKTSPKIEEIGKDLKKMSNNADDAGNKIHISFKGIAKAAAGLAVGLSAIKVAFSAVRGTAASFGEALDIGGRLSDLSQQTGEQAGNLLVLERAFDNAGAGADKVGGAVNSLQKFMVAAADGGDVQTRTMDYLGVSLSQLAGKTPTDQMGIFAKALSDVEDPAKRADLAMKIFGTSGGALLPVLRNFAGEVSNAKGELGSMPSIMNKYNDVFGTVSDQIGVISGKLTEFAAGVLSKVMPALELITTALANFDAAGFGAKLAGAFVGGKDAMNGFSAALAAFKTGNFSDMFTIAFSSIVLQAKQTANEIYRNMVAAFTSSGEFIKTIFGPGSAVFVIVKEGFSILGNELSLAIGIGLKPMLEQIPGLGSGMAEGIGISMRVIENEIKNSTNRINNLIEDGEILGDLERAGKAFPESFKKAYDSTKPLLAVEEDLAKVANLSKKYADDMAAYDMRNDIKNFSKLPEYLKAGKDHLKEGAAAVEKSADKLKETLSLSQQIIKNIREAEGKDKIDKGGKLEKKANEPIGEGNFKKAERIANRVLRKEEDEALQNLGPFPVSGKEGVVKRSLQDIAKEQGIDTFRKTNKQIRDELLEKKKKKDEDIKIKPEGNAAEKEKNNAQNQVMQAIKTAVESIRMAVEKIEPKLPTNALGV
jgi:hypothetical protein